ncbi:MAG: DUF1013 domain-containing protein [Rickettsiales bacterium]
MSAPLMPKATAVWLVDNTTLTFDQVAVFCNLHPLEVQAIADGEVAANIIPEDPIVNGELDAEEISRCEKDPNARLQIIKSSAPTPKKKKVTKYTPIARRQDKPDAVYWIIKNCPEMTDAKIVKLIGTTKNTIQTIRNREHWNMSNLRAKDPVILGLCTQTALDEAINIAREQAKSLRDKTN